jgi:hypothetical protein
VACHGLLNVSGTDEHMPSRYNLSNTTAAARTATGWWVNQPSRNRQSAHRGQRRLLTQRRLQHAG